MARSIEPCVNEMLVRDDAHHMTPTRSGSAEPDTTPSWGVGFAPRAVLDHPRLRDGRARVEPDHSEDDPEVAVVGVVDLIARDRDEGGRASYFAVKKVSW